MAHGGPIHGHRTKGELEDPNISGPRMNQGTVSTMIDEAELSADLVPNALQASSKIDD